MAESEQTESLTDQTPQKFEVPRKQRRALEKQKNLEFKDWNTIRLQTFTCDVTLSQKFAEFLKSMNKPNDKEEKIFTANDILVLFLKVLLYKFVPSSGAAESIFTNYLSENASPRFDQFPTSKLQLIQDQVKKRSGSDDLLDELHAVLAKILNDKYLPFFLKSQYFRDYKKGFYFNFNILACN